ncbi:MAG: hypothetical protein RLZZ480_716 [Candidatus Parcubacteria bacterium]|jgi:cold shock CspA family protein
MSKNITGQIVRFEADRGFAIVSTEEGDIFVHTNKAAGKWQYFAMFASVKLEWTTEYNSRARNDEDRYRKVATRVVSVEAAEEFEVLTKVTYFDPAKGFGRVAVGDTFSHDSAFLPGRVCEDAGLGRPGPGMPIHAIVVEGPKGPVVTSFEWGKKVEAEYAEKNAPASEEVTLKFFNRRKSFGFFVRADGTELHFHASNIARHLDEPFYHDKRFTAGSRFKVTLEEYRGKPTAKVVELIELAPESDAEVGQDVQSEPTDAVVVAAEVTEVAAEANAEAAPEEAPKPKRAKAAKKPAEAKGDEPKAEAKPKAVKKSTKKGGKASVAETPLEAEAEQLPDGPMADMFRNLGLVTDLASTSPAGNA